jgi:hypothetical protein
MRLASRLRTVCALASILASGDAAAATGAPRAEIVAIAPARTDTLLCCTLSTLGLPDAATRETLASGLPSALVVAITLLDAGDEHRGEALSEVRVEPDLWSRTFMLWTPLSEHRVRTVDEIASLLAELGPLPVARMKSLRSTDRFRIRARLAVHPLAPAEAHRVHAILGGEMESGGPNRKEVSVSIGSLIRYFLKHGEEEEWVCEATSHSFVLDTLSTHP